MRDPVRLSAQEGIQVPSLGEIAAVMKQQRQKIASLLVDCEETGQFLDDRNIVQEHMPYKIEGELVKYTKSFAYKLEKRYYHHIRRPLDESQRKPVGDELAEIEVTFDGSVLRRKYRKGTADILDRKSPHLRSDNGWFPQDYMRNIGWILPDPFDAANDRSGQRFPDKFTKGEWRVGATLERIDGCPCVTVSGAGEEGWEKIWLDSQMGYALRQWDFLDPAGKLLRYRFHNQDFVRLDAGVWLPRVSWIDVAASFSAPEPYRGKPLLRNVYTVIRVKANEVPDSIFSLEIAPGTLVFDQTLLPGKDNDMETVAYTMPADISQLDKTIENALAERARQQPNRWLRPVLVAVGGITLAAVVGVYLARHLRRKRQISGLRSPECAA
jgi:hypothetical protein